MILIFSKYSYVIDAVDTVTAKASACHGGTGETGAGHQQHGSWK